MPLPASWRQRLWVGVREGRVGLYSGVHGSIVVRVYLLNQCTQTCACAYYKCIVKYIIGVYTERQRSLQHMSVICRQVPPALRWLRCLSALERLSLIRTVRHRAIESDPLPSVAYTTSRWPIHRDLLQRGHALPRVICKAQFHRIVFSHTGK